jgi:hypothetical protein
VIPYSVAEQLAARQEDLDDLKQRHPWVPNDAPLPLNFHYVGGSWRNANGSTTFVYCLIDVAGEHPEWEQENMLRTWAVGGVRCNVRLNEAAGGSMTGTVRALSYPSGAQLASASFGAQHEVPEGLGSGWQAYGVAAFDRASMNSVQQVKTEVRLVLPVWAGTTGHAWSTRPGCTRGASAREITCELWSPPFETLPYPCRSGKLGTQPPGCTQTPVPCDSVNGQYGLEPNCISRDGVQGDSQDRIDALTNLLEAYHALMLAQSGLCPRANSDPVPPTAGGQEEPFNTDICDPGPMTVELSDPLTDGEGLANSTQDPDSMYDRGPGAIGPYDGQIPTPLGEVAASKRCGNPEAVLGQASGRKHDRYDVFRTYEKYSGTGAIQLRWGHHNHATQNGFGWRHIRDKHGWSRHISWCIRRTYNEGDCKKQGDSATRVRCRKVYPQNPDEPPVYRWCPFRVVYELNPAPRGPSGPVGILTAFFESCTSVI